VADVAELDLVSGVESRIGSEIAVRERVKAVLD
jgi:hypothetical protein